MTLVNLLGEYASDAKDGFIRSVASALRAADSAGFMALALLLAGAGLLGDLMEALSSARTGSPNLRTPRFEPAPAGTGMRFSPKFSRGDIPPL